MKSYVRAFTGLIGILVILGTCGFVLFESWPVIDSLYMTVITLSTVGYGEIGELSDSGRMFTSLLIGISVISMACWTASITSFLVSDDISGRLKARQDRNMIRKMKRHAIICGGGLLARTVAQELTKRNKQAVLITDDPTEIQYFTALFPNIPIVNSDPKSELALADANCCNADCIIAATDNDYDNLLITITGRGLGEQMKVIACAKTNDLTARMLKIGADDVVCPLILAGEQAANLVE